MYCSFTEYTIVVTGCTGRGKSTFCNFLSKSNKFKSEALPGSEGGWEEFGEWGAVAADLTGTQFDIVEASDLVGRVTLRIIDLPGYLATQNRTGNVREDLAKDGKMVLDEFAKALTYARDGIDAIFIALKAAERYTREEELLMEFISLLQLWDHCILLFTHGDKVGKEEDQRYTLFYKMIQSPDFPGRCPVLHKMLQSVDNRFVIVESVHTRDDQKYYLSKVDEICKAVEVVRYRAGSAIGHPLLNLARSAFKAGQVQLDMRDMLDKEKEEKGKFQQEAKKEQEKCDQFMRQRKDLQDALQQGQVAPEDDGDDKQDAAAISVLMNWLKEPLTGPKEVADMYAHLSAVADDRVKMMDELNVLIQQLHTGIGLAFKKRVAQKINDILIAHNVEVSGDPSNTIVSESNERDDIAQTGDANGQQGQRSKCRLL